MPYETAQFLRHAAHFLTLKQYQDLVDSLYVNLHPEDTKVIARIKARQNKETK